MIGEFTKVSDEQMITSVSDKSGKSAGNAFCISFLISKYKIENTLIKDKFMIFKCLSCLQKILNLKNNYF